MVDALRAANPALANRSERDSTSAIVADITEVEAEATSKTGSVKDTLRVGGRTNSDDG
jgi:hypothetical protein